MPTRNMVVTSDPGVDGPPEKVYIDGLSASGGGTTITDVVVNMLDADGTASGSVSGTTLTINVPRGATGTAATVEVGDVTTGEAGSSASVTNSGTSSAARLDFTIPRGATGSQGTAATIQVGSVTSGATASVTNTGTASDAVFDFVLPRGEDGTSGTVISNVSVTVDGTYSATPSATGSVSGDTLTLSFTGLRGAGGDNGTNGVGVKDIALTVTDGAVTAGTWTDTDDGSHVIDITTINSSE